MLKPGIAIAAAVGLAAMVAGGAGYWLASRAPVEPAPVIILPAPMAPPTVASQPPQPVLAAPSLIPPPEPAKRIAKKPENHTATARRVPVAVPDKVTKRPAEPVRVVAVEAPRPSAPEPVVAVAVESPKPAPPPPARVAPPAPVREARSVTIPAGTLITLRLNQELSSERNTEGDAFSASLDQPLVIDGLVIAERGSRQQGRVLASERAGRVKGRASIQLGLVRLATADGQNVELQTDPFTHVAERSVKKDVARAGVASAIGAAIGAIAGGGKGAAIGAGVGGAAGAGSVLATRGEDAELRAETRISFRLARPVTLTEKLN